MNLEQSKIQEMLKAVKSFQEGYTMTPAEAAILSDPSKRNRPKIVVKNLPIKIREK